ncbi:glyoxalase/bleomycin resistance/extradiol dioxygenase family protein [Tenacibaculum sp. Bg11-29]|uniref:VOC family protein n=1 Tax=Tenacibaculum sp. Bg11-29 TaxID=2058306 RepID=UPI000C34A63E|nr:VOC family protein [Tenacibaculum sp. Bg11-29]PKH50604.1 glyoxalase/bleomycin resistance/extradiol dioxygenase family protein [Tenacibaculum sp. Bg11-29]
MNLNQITIPSLNVEESTIFYIKLGLHLIVDASPRYVRFEVPDGDATFSVHKVDELPKGDCIKVYFEDENLDKLVEELQDKGIVFSQLPKDETWLWREAHLLDPDGNKIILFKAGKNRKNPPWRIN